MAENPADTSASEPPVPHPGDVAQVTDPAHPWHGIVGIVDAVHSWGIHISLLFPDTARAGRVIEGVERLKPGQFVVIGAAPLLKPAVLAARRDSLETARIVAEEAQSVRR